MASQPRSTLPSGSWRDRVKTRESDSSHEGNGSAARHHKYIKYEKYRKAPPVPQPPPPAFGPLIRSITVADIAVADKDTPLGITDCELVSSYNWMDSQEPTILIPGGPPRWTPLARPTALNSDAGTYLRDINSARLPLHPMEPVAHAVRAAQKTGDVGIDIVTCGSALGNLHRFARRNELDPWAIKPFRLVAQLVRRNADDERATLFLVRRENSPDMCISGVTGFGHTFAEANTAWDAETKSSASHQRLLAYSFGGLRIMLRFEADAYVNKQTSDASPASDDVPASEDDLDLLLKNIGLGTKSTAGSSAEAGKAAGPAPGLIIQHGGTLHPQAAVLDIKTRSVAKKDQYDDILAQEMPRFWCRQMPRCVLAFHTRGFFDIEDIHVVDLREGIAKWEEDHQEALQKLAALLRLVVAEVKRLPVGDKLEICHTVGEGANEELEFREAGPGAMDALSAAGQDLWMCRDDGA